MADPASIMVTLLFQQHEKPLYRSSYRGRRPLFKTPVNTMLLQFLKLLKIVDLCDFKFNRQSQSRL